MTTVNAGWRLSQGNWAKELISSGTADSLAAEVKMQKKSTTSKKSQPKLRDLKPKKDAKGGQRKAGGDPQSNLLGRPAAES